MFYTIVSFLVEVIDIHKLQTGNILTMKVVTIISLKPEKKTKKKHIGKHIENNFTEIV